MNPSSLEDTRLALEQMKNTLDKMLAPFYPDLYDADTPQKSLMTAICEAKQKPAKPSVDRLDELEEQVEKAFDEYYEECEEELEVVYRRLCLLYHEADQPEDTVMCGALSLVPFEDEMAEYYEVLLNNIESGEMEAILEMKAMDLLLQSYIDLGSHYEIKDFELDTLHKIADGLEDACPPEGLAYLEHLIRQLKVNIAILIHELDNENVRGLYFDLSLDLSMELVEDPEVIDKIDKSTAHKLLFHATSMKSDISDDDRELIGKAYNLTY